MNIFNKKYQIFISSTYSDLIKERSEVIKVILDIYQIPIGMEMFSADNDDQWNTIKTTIESSDYYLLIIGHRYGSLTKEQISYTEKEFDYAKKIGVPILSFIKERNLPTSPNQRDKEVEKAVKLQSFLKKVQNNSMCDYWSSETDLAKKVAVALPKIIFKTPRIGWIRSDKVNTLATSEELTKLNQENRDLRDEIEKLKAIQSNEQAKINVLINGQKELILKHQVIRESIKLNSTYEELHQKYKKFTSPEQFHSYNQELIDKKDEIEIYRKKKNKYINLTNNSLRIDLQINNEGNIKVNDLYIDIYFPESVAIIEKDEIDSLKNPKNPISFPNPIKKAKNEYWQKEKNKLGDFTFPLTSVPSNFSPSFGNSISHMIARPNKNFFINEKENKLTIKLEKLLHTRSYKLQDEIYVAGLIKGTYTAEVKIVADEIKKIETQNIKIIVE